MCHSASYELWVLLYCCCCCTGKQLSFFLYFFSCSVFSATISSEWNYYVQFTDKAHKSIAAHNSLVEQTMRCTVCVQCSWLFALSCAAGAAKYVEFAEIKKKKKRPHSYQAMFVESCQYLLYYKSYVDLSTTTLITLGLEMLTLTQHGALRMMRAWKWREGERERRNKMCSAAAFRCVPKRYTTCFSRILMYRDIMNHTTADSIHRFPFRLKQQKLQKLFAHTIQNILR